MQIKTLVVLLFLIIIPLNAFSGGRNTSLKDAFTGDNLKSGTLAAGLYFFDESDNNFDRVRGSLEKGLQVDIKHTSSSELHTIFFKSFLLPPSGTNFRGERVDLGQVYTKHSWQFNSSDMSRITACSIELRGSIDGINFFKIDEATEADIVINSGGEGFLKHMTEKSIRYVTAFVVSINISGGAIGDITIKSIHSF